jgi:hypothetical protein
VSNAKAAHAMARTTNVCPPVLAGCINGPRYEKTNDIYRDYDIDDHAPRRVRHHLTTRSAAREPEGNAQGPPRVRRTTHDAPGARGVRRPAPGSRSRCRRFVAHGKGSLGIRNAPSILHHDADHRAAEELHRRASK